MKTKRRPEVRPTQPRIMGCLHAGWPDAILKQSDRLHPGFGEMTVVEVRRHHLPQPPENAKNWAEAAGPPVGQIAKEFVKDDGADYYLKVDGPLSDQTYLWDRGRRRWVLIGQGLGFA